MKLQVVEGNIATLDVDAVVNAANTAMRGGGGVDGAIHAAAGRGLLAECIERFPDGLPTGGAGWTHGHRMAARWVIHVVGPIYDGTGGNRDLLVSCYRNALAVADELIDAHGPDDFTVAFPLVSAGVYGWPREDAIAAQVETLTTTPTRVQCCVLVGYGKAAADELRRAVASS